MLMILIQLNKYTTILNCSQWNIFFLERRIYSSWDKKINQYRIRKKIFPINVRQNILKHFFGISHWILFSYFWNEWRFLTIALKFNQFLISKFCKITETVFLIWLPKIHIDIQHWNSSLKCHFISFICHISC